MTNNHDVDLNAIYYRKNSDLQYGLASELLKKHQFNPKEIVLDVGCGDGRITAEIAAQVPKGKVIGVDASINMIDCAKTSFPKSKFPNLEFELEKAENLSFSEYFDVIFSFSCLHWVRRPQKVLNLLCNFLKPDGELFILTYPKESVYYEFLQKTLENYPEYQGFSSYYTMLYIKEYKEMLENNHMKILEFTFQELTASYENKKAIKDYIRGWLASFVSLPESLHEEFLDLAVENSFSYSKCMENGIINLPYTALMINARK